MPGQQAPASCFLLGPSQGIKILMGLLHPSRFSLLSPASFSPSCASWASEPQLSRAYTPGPTLPSMRPCSLPWCAPGTSRPSPAACRWQTAKSGSKATAIFSYNPGRFPLTRRHPTRPLILPPPCMLSKQFTLAGSPGSNSTAKARRLMDLVFLKLCVCV